MGLPLIAAVLDPVLAPLGFAGAQFGSGNDREQVIFCRGFEGSTDGGCLDLVLELEASPEWHIVEVRYGGFTTERFQLPFDRAVDLDGQLAGLARTLPGLLEARTDAHLDEA